MLPTALCNLQQPLYRRTLAVQPLAEQQLAPAVSQQQRVVQQLLSTTYPALRTVHTHRVGKQTGQVVAVARVLQFTLLDRFALRVEYLLVGIAHHMQYYRIVRFVLMMLVPVPVTRVDMQLYVTHPLFAVYADARMAVIRARITVVLTHRDDLYRLAVRRLLRISRPQTMLPYVMQQYLRHNYYRTRLQSYEKKSVTDAGLSCEPKPLICVATVSWV